MRPLGHCHTYITCNKTLLARGYIHRKPVRGNSRAVFAVSSFAGGPGPGPVRGVLFDELCLSLREFVLLGLLSVSLLSQPTSRPVLTGSAKRRSTTVYSVLVAHCPVEITWACNCVSAFTKKLSSIDRHADRSIITLVAGARESESHRAYPTCVG